MEKCQSAVVIKAHRIAINHFILYIFEYFQTGMCLVAGTPKTDGGYVN